MSLILELVRRHGIESKRVAVTHGGEYAGPCPGCGGEDRFRIWPEENEGDGSYWCRQCGKGGDCIQFLRDFDGLSFHEACAKLGKEIPDSWDLKRPRKAGERWEARQHESPEVLWRDRAYRFTAWAYGMLIENREQMASLSSRGIREESVTAFGLGWNPGKDGKDLYRDRGAWGLSKIVKEDGRKRPLWLPVGLVIPYFVGHEIQRLRIRRPKPVHFGPPYYVVPGSSGATMIIPPDRERQGRDAYVIVESELDGILVSQEAGDLAGAVALGSSSSKPDDRATKVLKAAAWVLNAIDFDRAGAQARHWWDERLPDSRRWPVPKGKDPGEAYQGGVDIRSWIRAGLPPGLAP